MADDDKDSNAGGKPEGDDAGLKSALEKERARAQEAENQLKAMRVEMAKLKQDDDASKSELQKVQEQIQQLRKESDEAQLRALRAEVAQAKKLTPGQAKRLTGATREELEADADELLTDLGVKVADGDGDDGGKDDGARPAARPKEKLRPDPGAAGESEKTGEQLAEEVWKRTRGEL